jgi:hypothetical protein
MFITTTIFFLLATANIAGSTADFITAIRVYLVKYVGLPSDEVGDLDDKAQFPTQAIGEWTANLIVCT